ncbi:efflux RND transporter periplasmic adaptor subunit [Pseudacidovorax intermedius]|uniref:RND transporter n=1 Tax=Pseudacidovorax intermedius TaxID=433924 RepID=A0A147GNM9_9BURK|nr:efflux RND transporter periplasmic adaptor subunit [Pseudacidovorax intermedius]KTT15673.1 RND transporter [Pseudacidovorax intermedius]
MQRSRRPLFLVILVVAVLAVAAFFLLRGKPADGEAKKADQPAATARPALTVTVVQPQPAELVAGLPANGNIAAWQEAVIGSESAGLRLADVRVNVGDVVRKGQVLATFSGDTVKAEVAQARASLAEAEAAAADAAANADRARTLSATGALSQAQINQYLTTGQTAKARVEAARAALQAQQVRQRNTQVLAPDDGVISSRTATVGAVVGSGAELFRVVRRGRLEWRAEVASNELPKVRVGQKARVTAASGVTVEGTVRALAPTVDPQTRNALVYVDLPANGDVRAGMYARGEFMLGRIEQLTVPQSAVVVRDGFASVFEVGADGKVAMRRVTAGQRAGDRIAIAEGVTPQMKLVERGAAFLNDGDVVQVQGQPASAAAAPAPKQ